MAEEGTWICRAHWKDCCMAGEAVKKPFFSATIASAQSHPAEFFLMVKDLLYAGPQEDNIEHTVAFCEEFTDHFAS